MTLAAQEGGTVCKTGFVVPEDLAQENYSLV